MITNRIFLGIVAVIITTIISILIVPLIKKLAIKLGALDYPNNRKVHTMPIPRLGGLGIVISFYIGIIIAFGPSNEAIGIIVPSLFIVLAGVLDDIFSVGPKVKLTLQFLGAVAFVTINPNSVITFFNLGGQVFNFNQLSVVITIIWLIGVSNAVNLIDGLDGLAGGVSLISAVTLGIVCLLTANNMYAIVAFILVASIIGFLKYNFYPASIFMGDTGALFLGFVLGELSVLGTLKGAAFITLLLPVLVLGVPIFDTLWSILRRLISGKPVMTADKNHLHHRLLKNGFSHRNAVLFIYCLSAILGVTAILVRSFSIKGSILIVGGVLVFLIFLFYRMGLFKQTEETDKEDSGEEK